MRFSLVAAIALLSALLSALLNPAALFCQKFRGTISGSVKDPSGAPMAGVKITVIETNTGTKVQTVSDAAGEYTAPYLQPGDYQIAANMQGFKDYVRKGFSVASGAHVIIDIQLEVGVASQTVSVTSAAPLLNTENASAGSSITHEEVQDLPLNGGTPMALAALSLGVIATGQPGLIHPFDSSGAAGWSVGGGYAQTSELLIDGSPDATWDGRLAYSLTKDAVQEVNVKAFDADAAYGHTRGGTLKQVIKTRTNSLRGTAFEQNEPNTLTANNFFNNAKGVARPVTHFNQYGVTAGGPMWIPKVFNGRNKLFWFFAWEGLKDAQPSNIITTVPTAAERTGNFSALTVPIYDPNSAVLTGTTITRTAFPGNMIPANRLNPISQAYLQYYPQPNITPLANGFDNFGNGNVPVTDNYSNELGRIDYNMSDKSRLAFNIRHNDEFQAKNNYFDNIGTGTTLTRENWGGSADEVYTFTPTMLLDLRLNFTRLNEVHGEPSEGFNPSSLGFPGYIAGTAQYPQMPFVGYSGSCGSQASIQCLGDTGASKDPSQSLQLF